MSDGYEAQIAALYAKHDPGRVLNIKKLLGEYQGREEELITLIASKYNNRLNGNERLRDDSVSDAQGDALLGMLPTIQLMSASKNTIDEINNLYKVNNNIASSNSSPVPPAKAVALGTKSPRKGNVTNSAMDKPSSIIGYNDRNIDEDGGTTSGNDIFYDYTDDADEELYMNSRSYKKGDVNNSNNSANSSANNSANSRKKQLPAGITTVAASNRNNYSGSRDKRVGAGNQVHELNKRNQAVASSYNSSGSVGKVNNNLNSTISLYEKSVASWKIRYYIEVVRRKNMKADLSKQNRVLSREIERLRYELNSILNENGGNKDEVMDMDSLKQSIITQQELLNKTMQKNDDLETSFAKECQKNEALKTENDIVKTEIDITKKTCQELVLRTNTLEAEIVGYKSREANRDSDVNAIHDGYKLQMDTLNVTIKDNNIRINTLKQTIVDVEKRENEVVRKVTALLTLKVDEKEQIIDDLKSQLAVISQEKSDLVQELEKWQQIKGAVSSKFDEVNSTNEKLVADHKVYEQLITDFSIKARDNEKTQRSQLTKIAELGNKISVQQGTIDTLEANLGSTTAQLNIQTAKADRLTMELDHVSMTNEDNEEWLRLRTATLINTSGYCRFIEEQLFNARRMAVSNNDALGNPMGAAGPSQQRPGADFTDMFNQDFDDNEYPDNISNHTSIEQIESKITAMLEGIESRITNTLMEAGRSNSDALSDNNNVMAMIEQMESRLKSAVLDAIPNTASSAMEEKIKNAIIEASSRAISSISPTKAGANVGTSASSMNEIMETMEERLNKLINDATKKLQNVVLNAPGVNPAAADSEHITTDSGMMDASSLVNSKENRVLKQKIKAEAINARVQYEQLTSLLDDTAEELTILYHSKLVARNNIVKWSKDFTALCGYPPSRNDKDKSNVFVHRFAKELVAAQTEYKLKCDEYHQHVDEIMRRRAEMVDAYRALENVTGAKQVIPDEYKPHNIKQMIVEDPFDVVELPNEKNYAESTIDKFNDTRPSEAVASVPVVTHHNPHMTVHHNTHAANSHTGNQVEPNMKKISTSDSIPIKVSSSSSLLVSDKEEKMKVIADKIKQGIEQELLVMEELNQAKAVAINNLKVWTTKFTSQRGRAPTAAEKQTEGGALYQLLWDANNAVEKQTNVINKLNEEYEQAIAQILQTMTIK